MSPLLANIYLHELDRYMESKYLNLTEVPTSHTEENREKETSSTSDMPMTSWCSVMAQRQKPTPQSRKLENSCAPWD